MKKWLLKVILLSLHKADANGDGVVELSVKLNIDSKELTIELK